MHLTSWCSERAVRKWMLQFLWCSASKPEYRVNEFWDYHAGSTPNTRSFAAESKRDWPDFRPDCDLQMRVRRRMLIDSIYWCNLQSVCAVIQSLRQGLNKVRAANLSSTWSCSIYVWGSSSLPRALFGKTKMEFCFILEFCSKIVYSKSIAHN